MRNNWRNRIILTLTFLSLLMACTKSHEHAEHADTYICPMHPTVVSDRPATCPVCGMDLVRKAKPGEEVKITEDLAKLIKSPNEVVVTSIKTIKGEFKAMPVFITTEGVVTYDTRNLYTLPTRIGGRLEKVYIKYAFQPVKKGQKVAEIYSPELLTAQREVLYLLENDPTNANLIDLSKNRLYLLGLTKNQVDEMIQRKSLTTTFPIYSSHEGYVLSASQPAPTVAVSTSSAAASGMGEDMGASSGSTAASPSSTSSTPAPSDLMREGNYVSAGQTLFTIVNASALRVELNMPLSQASGVQVNDEVELDLGDGTYRMAQIDFVQPFFTEGEEFIKLRLYIPKHGALQVGQLVKATIRMKAKEALWIPKVAIVDLGLDKIVFVKERAVFKPKKIKEGMRTDGWVEILQGLSSSDEIASNAQYMIDSESFIRVK